MDLRKPLAAPLRAAFLNPPLFFGVSRLEGLGGLGVGPSFFILEGPGVAGSIFVLTGVTGSGLTFLVPVLMSCFNRDSKGASTMASSGLEYRPLPVGYLPYESSWSVELDLEPGV